MLNKITLGDMLIESDKIESGSVDLILTDLPYGTMNGINGIDWDFSIEPKKVFEIADKVLRLNGKMVLFSQEPYTNALITEATNNIPFCYKAIWKKDTFGNPLFSKKAMVGLHEDILVFSKKYELGKEKVPKNPVYHYLESCKRKSGISTTEFNLMYSRYVGKVKNPHRSLLARSWETSQFRIPSREVYNGVLFPTGFFPLTYEEMVGMNTEKTSVFNLWEGNKHKSNVLEYKKDFGGVHPTQKPVLLLEDLIKTFSNESDLVVDLTCGSGSTCVAAMNTNRNFIGIEQEQKYVDLANERIKEAFDDIHAR